MLIFIWPLAFRILGISNDSEMHWIFMQCLRDVCVDCKCVYRLSRECLRCFSQGLGREAKYEGQKLTAGIDQGGLLKELLELILEKAFDGDMGLMQFTADGKAFPSPQAHRVADGLPLLEFLGMVVGKALYGPSTSSTFSALCDCPHVLQDGACAHQQSAHIVDMENPQGCPGAPHASNPNPVHILG